jgi:hypothetical protein
MWHAWERKENCTRFWWESPKERDHSEDQGIGGRMVSEWILGRLAWGGGVDWIWLAQDKDRWRAVVNAVMNLEGYSATELVISYSFASTLGKNVYTLTCWLPYMLISFTIEHCDIHKFELLFKKNIAVSGNMQTTNNSLYSVTQYFE